MSYFVYGSSLSYNDFLQGKSFVDDIKSSNKKIAIEVSKQTRQLIASNETLAKMEINSREIANERVLKRQTEIVGEMTERITNKLSEGFETLSFQMQEISNELSELQSTFHWGFSSLIAELGGMNDSIKELIKIAKTPAQTAAMEHFNTARDMFRQKIYPDVLEELDKAINGVPGVSAGFKQEWRVHQLKGIVKLGFIDCNIDLVNLEEAEDSFLKAALYAQTDYPIDAATAYLSAGWAAYCQGKMNEAIGHSEKAISLNPNLVEAMFQIAKIMISQDQVNQSFEMLKRALKNDMFFALKAASDGDFQKHNHELNQFFIDYKDHLYGNLNRIINACIKDIPDELVPSNIAQLIDEAIGSKELMRFQDAINSWKHLNDQLFIFLERLAKMNGKVKKLQSIWTRIMSIQQDLNRSGLNSLDGYQRLEKSLCEVYETHNRRVMGCESEFDARFKELYDHLKWYISTINKRISQYYETKMESATNSFNESKERCEKYRDKYLMFWSAIAGNFFVISLLYFFVAWISHISDDSSIRLEYGPGKIGLLIGVLIFIIISAIYPWYIESIKEKKSKEKNQLKDEVNDFLSQFRIPIKDIENDIRNL